MSAIPVGNDARNDTASRRCAFCGEPFQPSGRRRYHSDACRVAAHRARKAAERMPKRLPRAQTVYECPDCGARQLGSQRCPECNLFCRSLGPGGECPCCGEPVGLVDLLGELPGPTP